MSHDRSKIGGRAYVRPAEFIATPPARPWRCPDTSQRPRESASVLVAPGLWASLGGQHRLTTPGCA
jgi:hypothetical protein